MDRLTALTVFRRVVELGSFAAASRRLGLSPAAISKNIGELEAHLSVRLINRTTRRMSLTEAGSLYFDRIVRVLDGLSEADSEIAPTHGRPRGLLRVSAPMTLTLTRLSGKIPHFLEKHPDLSLDLHLDDRRVRLVEEGFDLAIRGSDRLEDSSLIAKRLTRLRHVVCAAPAYLDRAGVPQTPAELAAHSCIQFTRSDHVAEWPFSQAHRACRVQIKGRYRVASSLAVRDALLAGFGLSLIPWLYVQADLAQGRLQTVLDDWKAVETDIYAVYPSKQHVPTKVQAFIEFVVDVLSEKGDKATA